MVRMTFLSWRQTRRGAPGNFKTLKLALAANQRRIPLARRYLR